MVGRGYVFIWFLMTVDGPPMLKYWIKNVQEYLNIKMLFENLYKWCSWLFKVVILNSYWFFHYIGHKSYNPVRCTKNKFLSPKLVNSVGLKGERRLEIIKSTLTNLRLELTVTSLTIRRVFIKYEYKFETFCVSLYFLYFQWVLG